MDGKKINLKKKKKRKFDSKLLSAGITAGLILILGILLYLYINYYFFGGRITNYVEKKEIISILFTGLDDNDSCYKTDTLILGLYNPLTKRFGLIFLPRDLKVKVETKMGINKGKINSVYSKYGMKKLLEVITSLTGLDVKFHVSMRIEDIIKIVDLIGGVNIYVNKAMKYTDKSADLYIELPRGIIKCDGVKAMQFIRYRSDERGDMGRIERQYEFILNIIKKSIVKNNILQNLKILKVIYKKVKTNLNFNDIINLIKYTSTADFNNVEMIKVGGEFVNEYGVEYIQPDLNKSKKNSKNLLNKLTYTKKNYIPQEIKVQVLNGSGKRGMAKRVRDKLVRNGFNVIEFGNADSQNYENMLILDREGNMKKALKVAGILKIRNVFPNINHIIMIDVKVIVGKDYKKHLKDRIED